MDNRKIKNRTRPERLDQGFRREIKDLAKFRYMKNLDRKELSFPEMSKIMRRTDSWRGVVFELKTKPKKEEKK
jgi:hypothetical protein|tara:strand:- start:721 stop:939 length:219 start_codon:yes stop_codon:yes gene_type:complete